MTPLATDTAPAVAAWVAEHRKEVLDDLRVLVEHESPSRSVPHLDRAADLIEGWVRGRLGPPDAAVRNTSESYGDVLDFTYRGRAPGTVLVVGHYDTVWPEGTIDTWPFQVVDGRATGPGVFDMKAGLVQSVWALAALRAGSVAVPTVRLLFNGDEELGSTWSRTLVEEAASEADAVLVAEPGGSRWAVKTHRKGTGIFSVEARGIEAHAGLDPTRGASAVHGMADAVTQLAELADHARGTSVNVGLIEGGTARNVVAGVARCLVDVRVSNTEEITRLDGALRGLRARDPRVLLTVGGGWNRPPMTLGPQSEPLFALAEEVSVSLRGAGLEHPWVGGGSDANFVGALGKPVLCGLGPLGDGAHARHEHVNVDDVPDRTALLAGCVALIGERGAEGRADSS